MFNCLRPAGAVVAAILLAGCAAAPSAVPSPSAPPSAGPGSGTIPPASTAAPSVDGPSTTPPPELLASPSLGGWRPVPAQAVVTGVQFQAVTWTGARFVAVGASDAGGAFLDSGDGITWHMQDVDPTWSPASLTSLDDGTLVAIGLIGETRASWRSSDGLEWAVAPAAGAVPGDAVAAAAGRWVAVGTKFDDQPCASYCPPVRALAWTSADGVAWAAAPRQASLATSELKAVVRFGSAWFAGGSRGEDAAVWSSPDGVRWSRIHSDAFTRSRGGVIGSVSDMLVVGSTLVAVGTDSGQDAAHARAWWTTDGRAWHDAPMEHATDGQVFHVSWTGAELLATGPSTGCDGGIWSSADGRAWACAAGGERIALFGAYDAAGSDTIEVAAGLTDEGYDEDSEAGLPGAVWWRVRP